MRAPTTPLARTTAAALARVLDCIPRGYTRYTSGTVAASKLGALVSKFHNLYGVAASAAQRITRKKNGKANAVLAVFFPDGAEYVSWLMLFTDGELGAHEALRSVSEKPRLRWLGYELTRYNYKGGVRWTWRREPGQMQDLYILLDDQLRRRRWDAVKSTLERVAAQPGFHGVRGQSWRLCQEARTRGYPEELPFLFYIQKIGHGKRIAIA
ncbi:MULTISPECIES: hypothetical protein [unclassified Achromobacter]|uniref:hypothetical protein n=1 Tax=unclassified Achromobacter TaxID=2626865 RepID=UPI001E2E1A2E|nr:MULTISPECIES: hypothetical protein [unclassified Achromobacter]